MQKNISIPVVSIVVAAFISALLIIGVALPVQAGDYNSKWELNSSTGVKNTAIVPVTAASDSCPDGQVHIGVPIDGNNCIHEDRAILTYVAGIIRFLTMGAGLVITVMIVIAGVEYIIAGGNPQLVQDAKHKLKNAISALFLFIFAVALLNYLVPGGIL